MRAAAPEIDRTRRVAELIRRELSALLTREMDDQRFRMLSITAVTVSKDLKQASVYVSCIGGAGTKPSESAEAARAPVDHVQIEQALNHASKYLRHLLSQKITIRTTPALRFIYDHSIRQGVEMTRLIDSLNQPGRDSGRH